SHRHWHRVFRCNCVQRLQRMMSDKLKVGVEVEKGEEDGLFTKESVCKTVKIVMDDENEVGREFAYKYAIKCQLSGKSLTM
ncbi:UDP-glycosyltransferase 79B6-like, partial [Trifolium medium]|nr:UDP-glycosyltransferase 79B6-like [Trifolium medium]